MPATNGFLYGTVFLAFARLYPDFMLYILFVLPVKIQVAGAAAVDLLRLRFLDRRLDGAGDDRGVGGQLLAVLRPRAFGEMRSTAIGGCSFRRKR